MNVEFQNVLAALDLRQIDPPRRVPVHARKNAVSERYSRVSEP